MIAEMSKKISDVVEQLKYITLNERKRMLYEDRIKKRRDAWAREEFVRREGIQLGREEVRKEGFKLGREEGIQLGREEGRQLGREEGRQLGREEGRQLVKKLIMMHLEHKSPEEIAEACQIPLEKVLEILSYVDN